MTSRRRRRAQRRLRWLLGAATAVVVLWGAWAAYLALQVKGDLAVLSDDVRSLRTAVDADDQRAVDDAVTSLRQHAGAAADRTHGPTWAVLERLPFYGDDLHGVAVVSMVADDLGRRGVEPLAAVLGDADSMLPQRGRIDPQKIMALQEPISSAAAAFADADRLLVGEQPDAFVEPLKTQYADLAEEVSRAAEALEKAETAVRVLPRMLGDPHQRTYLLVVQNNAEIRATGGLPGAVSVLTATDGTIELKRQVAGSSFGKRETPVLPLTEAETEIYGPILGTFFLDANLQPDFGRASQLWRARWEETQPERLDGILSLDVVSLSYLLEATGPVTVRERTLTSDNVVDELLSKVYARYEDPRRQDAFFRDAARAIFDTISTGAGSPRDLLSALSRATSERRIMVHDFDERTQAQLTGTAIANELVTDPEAPPQIGVYVNDGTGSKMSYYLRYDVAVEPAGCVRGAQTWNVTATIRSEAPTDARTSLPRYVTGGGAFGAMPGSQFVVVHPFAPQGGSITDFHLDGKKEAVNPADVGGRTAVTLGVLLMPKDTVELAWTVTAVPGDLRRPVLSIVPGLSSNASTLERAC